jgi:hypothetical protein
MQQLLARENDGKSQSEWSITCCLFAPYGPESNERRKHLATR